MLLYWKTTAFGSEVQSRCWSRSSHRDKEIRADISQDDLPDMAPMELLVRGPGVDGHLNNDMALAGVSLAGSVAIAI
jgi:hypothetical protein